MNKIAAVLAGILFLGLVNASAAGQLKHVVSFKFKSTASAQQIQKVVDDFAALKKKIQQIKSFEWRTNVSPEKLDKGFTHCFILSFKSAKDRDAYLVHPDHKAFGQGLGPLLGRGDRDPDVGLRMDRRAADRDPSALLPQADDYHSLLRARLGNEHDDDFASPARSNSRS